MIANLRKLLAAAAPGRWGAFGYGDQWVVEAHQPNSFAVVAHAQEPNAALIAAMHDALPKLLAVAKALKAEPRRGPTMSHRLMCDDTCGCPLCVTDNALAALEAE